MEPFEASADVAEPKSELHLLYQELQLETTRLRTGKISSYEASRRIDDIVFRLK